MQVITTHLNVDFDCLASMMAAKKLYPEAYLVLPGSTERLVKDFLKEENPFIEFTSIRDIPLDQVRLLVVVNTHVPEKIGIFAPLMDNPQVEVHIYDHHSDSQNEFKASHGVIKKRRASTTILYENIVEKKMPLTPEECTLMVLGIYEDINSLITVSNTPEDLIAARDLIKRGADLSRVSIYMRQKLNSEQLDILNELLSSSESLMIKGVEVTNDMGQRAEPSKVLFQGKFEAPKSLKSLIKKRLHKDVFIHLEAMSKIADRLNVSIYAVGGFVRDLLLNIPNKDIDIVVEGEGIPFAVCLGEEFGGKVTSHKKFGTSVVIFSDGYRIDVATARREYYKHPGALPTVEKSTIKSDLFRRDFTVNSMAVKLTGSNAFCLIDCFNGERNLRSGKIHVLHSLSFIEDPCRLFRAIRFEQRFGFAIGKQDEALMRSTIKRRLVDSLSGTRLFKEIKLLLNEKNPMDCVRRMQEFDLFQFVSPEMLKDPQDIEVLERLDSILPWDERRIGTGKPEVWYVYLLGLFYSLDEEAFLKAAKRLNFPTRIKNSLYEDIAHCRESLKQLMPEKECGPTEIYHAFANLSLEAVVFLMALSSTDRINKYVYIYFTQYHGKAKPSLTGEDLVKMGMEPGPVFKSVLNALREARVMGIVKSREEEVTLVEERFLKP